MVADLLAHNDLTRDDVDHWAVHPGGPRILDVVADRLELDSDALSPSRAVLDRHGNCSSVTVFLVVEEIRRTRHLRLGSHTVALDFGPGLTLHAALLRS
jgi:predicted naringenin-chalcone synthase